MEKINNIAVKALSKEHGARVIQAWEALGVNNINNLRGCIVGAYYGISNGGTLRNWRWGKPPSHVKETTLEELQALATKKNDYPKLMWVGSTQEVVDDKIRKRVVFTEKCGKFIAWSSATSFEEAENEYNTCVWRYAKDATEEDSIPEYTKERMKASTILMTLGVILFAVYIWWAANFDHLSGGWGAGIWVFAVAVFIFGFSLIFEKK